jgi:hypothetical protein
MELCLFMISCFLIVNAVRSQLQSQCVHNRNEHFINLKRLKFEDALSKSSN